jgi:hypothetical protein
MPLFPELAWDLFDYYDPPIYGQDSGVIHQGSNPFLPLFDLNKLNATGGWKMSRKDFNKYFTKKQRQFARLMHQFFFGSKCPNRMTYGDGNRKVTFQGIFDPKLSTLCHKSAPKRVTNESWHRDLLAISYHDYLPKITEMDVAVALFGDRHDASTMPSRIYVVANQNRNSTHGMVILDFDDKKKTGRIEELLKRFNAAFPDIMPYAYTERSPGGSGAHVCIMVDIGGLSHHQANDLLSDMSARIKAAVNRPDDPKGLDFDAIKGTFPWVEWQGQGDTAKMITNQGTFGTMPMPRTEEDLARLRNMKCHDLTTLANMVLGANETPATNESMTNEPMPQTMTNESTTHNNPTTILSPLPPSSSSPITTCVEHTAPTTSVSLQNNTTTPIANNTCVNKSSSPTSKKGWWKTIPGIRAEKSALKRKQGLAFNRAYGLGRPLQPNEAAAMAAAYVELGLNDTPPDWPHLTGQFQQVIKTLADNWNPSLACGGGPASRDLDFVNGLDVQANFAPLLKKRIKPETIVETMKVVVFLASEIVEPEIGENETELEHQRKVAQYFATLGPDRVQNYIISARKRGAKWTAILDRNVISACLGTAVRLGWLWLLQKYVPGKFCNRLVPGPRNPMQQAFLAKHGTRVNSFDPPMCFFAGWPADDMTPLSVASAAAAETHTELDWPETPGQPAAPMGPWTPVMARGATPESSAGIPAVTPAPCPPSVTVFPCDFFDRVNSGAGQSVEEDDFNMEPPVDEYDPSVYQTSEDYDYSADQPVEEYIVCA